MLTIFFYDYAGNLISTDPEKFFLWLQKHLGAIKKSSGEGYVVAEILGHVYKIKRAANLGSKESDHLPIRIEKPMTDAVTKELEGLGARVVDGKDHWRILDVWVEGKAVGRIHVAHRVSPLGT